MNLHDLTGPPKLPTDASEPESTQNIGKTRFAGLGLLLICCFLFFWRLGSVPLFDLDEGLYVTCARVMTLTGDIITPRLNTHPPGRFTEPTTPFYEKPIMVYWASAGSMRLFGISEWAARVPVAVAALLLTFVLFRVGKRWFGTRAGLLTAAIYATAPMTILDARQMTTDGLLVLWFSLALFAFWECYQAGQKGALPGESPGSAQWKWPLLFWTMAAAAVLTKGAVGLLLPFLVIGVFLALRTYQTGNTQEAWNAVRQLRPLWGFALFLLLTVPWHVAIWSAGGHDANGRTFFQEYIIHQHIGRFKGGDKVHNAPLPTYFAFFLIGFFPWACFAPAAFLARRTPGTENEPATAVTLKAERGEPAPNAPEIPGPLRTFLLSWFWTIFVFFSLSAAKLPTYIVPAYPAAALLIAPWFVRAFAESENRRTAVLRGAFGALITALLLVLVAVIGPRFAPPASPIPADIVLVIRLLAGCLTAGCGIAWLGLLVTRPLARSLPISLGAYVGMMLVFAGIAFTMGYALAKEQVLGPYQQLSAAAREDAANGIPVLYYHIIPRRPSMLYYGHYSPFEQRDSPLLPTLRMFQSRGVRAVDAILSLSTLAQQLQPELEHIPGITIRPLAQSGTARAGWVLVRIDLAH